MTFKIIRTIFDIGARRQRIKDADAMHRRGYAAAANMIVAAKVRNGDAGARQRVAQLREYHRGATEPFDAGALQACEHLSKTMGLDDAEKLPAGPLPPITDKSERHNGLRDAHALLLAYMEEINAEHYALPPAWHGGTRPRHVELTHMGAALVELGRRMEARGWEIIRDA